MSLGDQWFIDFDRLTLENKLQAVNFGIYAPTEREILPSDLNKIEFSLVKFESVLMRHFVAQFNNVYTFLNTESTTNENAVFQRYARKMLNYMKAEIHYCFLYWQNEKFFEYVSYRLIATLLRTYYFLLDLHMNVLKRIPNQNKNYWDADESLDDLAENLALRYQDLVSFVQSFEKSFEELYHKMEPLARSYPQEVNLIVAIWTISNMYFSYGYNDIKRVSSSKFSSDDENKLKERITTSNEIFRKSAEEARSKTFEEEQRELQELLTKEMYNSNTVSKMSQDYDSVSSSLVSKALSNMRQNAVKYESEEEYIEIRTKGNFLERLRQNAKSAANQKKSVNQKRNSTFENVRLLNIPSTKTLVLSQLNSVKDSPNNPLARNSIMHSLISDTGDDHDFRIKIPKEPATTTKLTSISHFNKEILSKLESDSQKHQKPIEYSPREEFFSKPPKKKDIYSKIELEEDEYLRIMNQKLGENLNIKVQSDSTDDFINQKKNRGGIFKSLQIMSQQSSLNLGDPTGAQKGTKDQQNGEKERNEGSDNSENDDEDDEGKKKKNDKAFKKKYGLDEEEFQRLVAEAASQDPHQPSKENKGDDIPDEDIMGDLIEQESATEDEEEEEEEAEDQKSENGSKRSSEASDKDETENKKNKNNKNSDEEEEQDDEKDHGETQEKLERERRKHQKELKEKAAAQQAISREEFFKFLLETNTKEPKEIKSKYFLPRRNFFYLGDDDNINVSRHTSKWCFLQDNYKYQSIEKEVINIKNQDYSNKFAPMIIERKILKTKLKKNLKEMSKPFHFAKQNPMSIFQDIVMLLAKDNNPPHIIDHNHLEEESV